MNWLCFVFKFGCLWGNIEIEFDIALANISSSLTFRTIVNVVPAFSVSLVSSSISENSCLFSSQFREDSSKLEEVHQACLKHTREHDMTEDEATILTALPAKRLLSLIRRWADIKLFWAARTFAVMHHKISNQIILSCWRDAYPLFQGRILKVLEALKIN